MKSGWVGDCCLTTNDEFVSSMSWREQIKTLLLNVIRTTSFWNKLYQVHSKLKKNSIRYIR